MSEETASPTQKKPDPPVAFLVASLIVFLVAVGSTLAWIWTNGDQRWGSTALLFWVLTYVAILILEAYDDGD